MTQFILTYIGGRQPDSPQEGAKHFAKYKEWLASLGENAVSPANPLKNTQTVNSDGSVTEGGGSSMSGFTIIESENLESALLVAQSCPFLDMDGKLEVSELIKMPF
jgi:hypothetical protein